MAYGYKIDPSYMPFSPLLGWDGRVLQGLGQRRQVRLLTPANQPEDKDAIGQSFGGVGT